MRLAGIGAVPMCFDRTNPYACRRLEEGDRFIVPSGHVHDVAKELVLLGGQSVDVVIIEKV